MFIWRVVEKSVVDHTLTLLKSATWRANLTNKATLPPLLSLSVLKVIGSVFIENNGYVRLSLTKHCNQNLSQAKMWQFSVIINDTIILSLHQ